MGLSFGALRATALWNARHLDAAALTSFQVLFGEKSTIGTIQLGCAAKHCLVAAQRGLDMVRVAGISVQHVILRDQPLRAFGEEHFMAEFHRRQNLPAFDQIRVRFEDGIDLLVIGNLLSQQHAATCLIDDALSETAIVFDLAAQFLCRRLRNRVYQANFVSVPQTGTGGRHNFLCDVNKLAIFCPLMPLSLRRCHPLQRLHASASRAGAIAKTLD